MGKMKMGSDSRNKSTVKESKEIKTLDSQPVIISGISEERLQQALEAMKASMPVSQPLTTMNPNPICQCSPTPKMIDKRARKHSMLLKNELIKDRQELDNLLSIYVQSNDQKLVDINQKLVDFELKLNEKHQEIQIVTEKTEVQIIEKPVMDKRMLLVVGASIVLNLILILVK